MTKIQYKSINLPNLFEQPLILVSDIVNDDSGKLFISVCGMECSYVIVNGKKYRLCSGGAEIELESLHTGICDVIFVEGTKRIAASAFFNANGNIERIPLDSATVKIVESILLMLSERLNAAEEKILALEEKILPKNIFKFN